MGSEGARELADTIRNLKQLTQLRIGLANNVGDEGAKEIANAIRNLEQLSYLYVNLERNPNIGEVGRKTLCDLKKKFPFAEIHV